MTAHVREQLSAYLDRELAGGDRQAVDVHLRDCTDCARALDQMRAVDALLRGASLEAPAGYFEGLPARLRARLRPARRPSVPAWTLALAAGIAVAVAAPLVMRERPSISTGAAPAAASQVPPAAAPVPVPPSASASAGAATAQAREPFAAAPTPRATAESKATTGAAYRLGRRDRVAEAEARPAAPPPPPPPAPAPGVVAGAPVQAADAVAGTEAVAPAEEDEQPEESLVDDSGRPEPRRERAAEGATRKAAPSRARGANVPDERFRLLDSRTARGADEARALRDAWLAFVRDDPEGPHADDARLRALEAGAAAWRLGGRADDRALVEREGREYLRRSAGAHHERVRALLASLEP